MIKALHYDADLPPNTQIELRSRSGNEMGEVYTFHNKIGEVVTEEKWNSSPKVLRGRVDTSVVVGGGLERVEQRVQAVGRAF